MIIWDWSRISH